MTRGDRSPSCRARSRATGASASSDGTLRTSGTPGRGVLTRASRRQHADDGRRACLGAGQVGPHRPAAGHRRGDRGATLQEEGAGHLQLRRHQLERLRDRGDPARPRRWPAPARSSSACPIAIAIALLLAVVSTSYRQIGYAYPSGGGAYAVARANLRTHGFALVAAGALLVDYVMTVAVSTSSAVEQIISAIPELFADPGRASASSPSC